MSFVRRSWLLACLFCLGIAGFATAQKVTIPGGQPLGQPKQPVQPKALPPAQPQPRGLPAGAVARLGQTRLRHADIATCVVFAPDGKSFITGGADGTIRVWSVETGEQINLLQKTKMSVASMKYTHDGKQLAVQFAADGLIRFLDSSTLKELRSVPFVNRQNFAISNDGKLIATSDGANNATITEVVNDLPKLELASAKLFDFRPDGKAIAVGDAKATVTVYLVTGGKPVFTVKQDGAIQGIAYSPDGKRLAVGSRSGNGTDVICVYESGNAKPVAEISGMNLPQAWLSTDTLACGNGTDAGVYNVAKKEWGGRIKGISGEFAISPDGTKLVATGNGLRVRLWDLPSGKQLHAENDSFPDPTLLVGSPDGKTLFLLTTDTAYLWALGAATAKPAGTLPGPAIAAAASGDKLIVATPDAVILYANFDPTKPLPARPTHVFNDSAKAQAVAVSPNGAEVAWAIDGKVTVTSASGKGARRAVPPTTTSVFALGFNPTGDRLGVLGRDPFLRVWDVSAAHAEVKEVWKARIQRRVKGTVAFSPDGKYLTAVSTPQLLVFDASDGKENDESRKPLMQFERYTENGEIHHAVFSPDSRTLIVGSHGSYGRVEMWELCSRGMVRSFVTGYGGTARLCIFPDGKHVASAGAEEAVTVWDLSLREGKAAPKAEELTAAVNDLSSLDASVGYPAIKLLSAAGNRGTEQIERAVKDSIATEKRIKGWIEDLGSKTFSVRDNAAKELIAQGVRALPALTLAAESEDRDLRDHAREVLGKLSEKDIYLPANGMTPDLLRCIRAVQALEEIGTPEAVAVLKRIRDVGGRSGEDAKTALERLKSKNK
jgi:WD40 repeat protein